MGFYLARQLTQVVVSDLLAQIVTTLNIVVGLWDRCDARDQIAFSAGRGIPKSFLRSVNREVILNSLEWVAIQLVVKCRQIRATHAAEAGQPELDFLD